MYDYLIIGAGIVGLGVANALQEQNPDVRILIIEKETAPAIHQTGRNSNVVHSGIYYKPGSLKARLAKKGNTAIYDFCRQHGLFHDRCGKAIVATRPEELPELEKLYQRGLENGLQVSRLTEEQLKAREPYVNGVAGLLVPDAGIVNYREIASTLARLITERGSDIRYGHAVTAIEEQGQSVRVTTTEGRFEARWLINCAGLFCDRIARMAGYPVDMRIIPFRGEYYVMDSSRNHLVNHLIYPVPNPDFPFLGVHFTRMYNGKRDVGPNAVLALRREGYKKSDISLRDTLDVLSWPGFWKIARSYFGEGMAEMQRSWSKKRFVESARQLIPALEERDIHPGPAGVRAQALTIDGKLVDDFHIVKGRRSLHVCNAPSPAATASLEIGREIVASWLT
ncbi:L-2-hydroxyglutarate oxidase [Entomohabitans teleogrylli]|uniref:L-2-hydroxyglutarate oxidase n=1 Tax=Entomohabitans teleogrylli TaxID=1384589 RepID=UPI00073DA544|nr:L-2-hydroxyglutarate oxidase [Entomohabitans teleogrylli]